MRVGLITPAPPRSRYGNRVTALRWARILRGLGHRVTVAQGYDGEPYDVMVALHARRSYDAIKQFHRERSGTPLIVTLTGTDLYQDIQTSQQAQESLELATHLILLQPKGIEELRPHLRSKARVIYQSVAMPPRPAGPGTVSSKGIALATGDRQRRGTFDVCVIGHLREVKDPFRTALAARLLPPSSRIRVLQIGGELEDGMAARAHDEMDANSRYRWVGEKPRWQVFRLLGQSQLSVLSSRLEGGANVLSEAIVASVPVLASRISGSIGVLGESYPGYFDVGDTEGLARLLDRAETDSTFLAELRGHCERLAPLFEPPRESATWADLLAELGDHSRSSGQ